MLLANNTKLWVFVKMHSGTQWVDFLFKLLYYRLEKSIKLITLLKQLFHGEKFSKDETPKPNPKMVKFSPSELL